MEIKYYLQIIIRRKYIFLPIFLLFVLVPLLLCLSKGDIYVASSKFLVNHKDLQSHFLAILPNTVGEIPILDNDAIFERFTEWVSDKEVVEMAVAEVGITEGENSILTSLPYLKFLFSSDKYGLNIKRVGESDIYEVEAFAPSLKKAVNLSNGVLEHFMHHNLSYNRDLVQSLQPVLELHRSETEERLKLAQEKIGDFVAKTSFNEPNSLLDELYQQLFDYYTSLNSLQINLASHKLTQADILKLLETIPEYHKYSETIARNPRINELKENLVALQLDLAKSKVDFTDIHPTVRGTKNQLQEVEELLKDEVETAFSSEIIERNDTYEKWHDQYRDNEITIIKDQVSLEFVQSRIKEIQGEINNVLLDDIQRSRLSAEVTQHLDDLTDIDRALTAVNIIDRMEVKNMYVVHNASMSENEKKELYFPSIPPTLAFSSFIGFFVALFLAFFVEYMDGSIHSKDRLRALVDPAKVLCIPKLSGALLTRLFRGKSLPRELEQCFYNLINIVTLNTQAKSKRIIGVTSAAKREGKTTVAYMLARSWADRGKKVLYIDCGINPSKKLLSSLSSNGEVLSSIHDFSEAETDKLKRSNLFIYRPLADSSRSLLDTLPGLASSISRLKESEAFHCVVIDTPSTTEASFVFSIIENIDYLFFATRRGKSVEQEVSRLYSELCKVKPQECIGVVCHC